MKTGMIFGIIGGLIALLTGAIGYGAASMGGALSGAIGYSDGQSTAGYYQVMTILLPLIALVGAGFSTSKPGMAVALMGIAAVGIVTVFGFGVLSMISVILISLGAIFVALDMGKGPYEKQK